MCVQYRMFCKKVRQQEKELEEAQGSKREESLRWQELQEKQDFFALWAHQIKTPIAALNLLLQEEKQDTAVCRQIYRGNMPRSAMLDKICDAVTVLMRGGEDSE